MQRIVDGILFEGQTVADAWDVSVWECNGHREVSARNVVEWREIGPVPALDPVDLERDAEYLEEKRLQALRINARRAQTECRRIIKAEGFDELLTLTYRENQMDRELCKKHFKEWVRRMKRALSGFRYCASFERQQRGAMHVHIACHKLPTHAYYKGVKVKAWQLGTQVWRGIVGADNGLCFVGGRTRWGGVRRSLSAAKMAAYVSKYITKDYADAPKGANRYSRSNAVENPKPERMRFSRVALADLIGAIFELGEGDVVVSHRVGRFGDSYWLCTEPESTVPKN